MRRTRPHVLIPLVLLVLLTGAGWSYAIYTEARRNAEDAAADEAQCRQLIARIESLRSKPAFAGTRELRVTELTGRVEQAARVAGCPAASIIRIDPEPARRLNETPYLEKPTQLLLRGLTLRQALTFLHSLSTSDPGLRLKATRLSAPPGEEAGDRWQLECTLAYLVYAPRGEGTGAAAGVAAGVEW